MKKGTTIAELVCSSCKVFPKKEVIENLVELGKQNESDDQVTKSVLEYQDHEGFNSLISMFEMASKYRNRNNNQRLSEPMIRNIEASCLYMIQLAKLSNLKLEKVLNYTTKTGQTLFCAASNHSERIPKLLLDAEANDILERELKDKWEEETYETIRSNPNYFGFASKYLYLSANFKEFSSSAEVLTLVKLAKLDLKNGTTIPQLVFSCCWWFPKKEAIESLIEVGKHNEEKEEIIESVFDYQDQTGSNCLISIFDMASYYSNEHNALYPSGPMLCEIEESCLYMIELARSSNLELEKILNQTTKNGDTLFFTASVYSEKITKRLLVEPVQVNSITDTFVTPFFRVRLKVWFLNITSVLV